MALARVTGLIRLVNPKETHQIKSKRLWQTFNDACSISKLNTRIGYKWNYEILVFLRL